MHSTNIYSSFFSSGLHHINSAAVIDQTPGDSDIDLELSESETEFSTSTPGDGTHSGSDSKYSPSRASSPIPFPPESEFITFNDNDMDVDFSLTTGSGEGALGRRSATPTPEFGSRQTTPVPLRAQFNTTTQRLRTRRSRSSLAQSLTSPKAVHAIKSPNRAASNALSLQMQMQHIHNRFNLNPGSDANSQSGTPSLSLKPRRLFAFARRRLPAAVPPPTAPLPALPSQAQAPLLSPSPLEDSTQHNLIQTCNTKLMDLPAACRRGLYRSSLPEHRIIEIEELKEN